VCSNCDKIYEGMSYDQFNTGNSIFSKVHFERKYTSMPDAKCCYITVAPRSGLGTYLGKVTLIAVPA
jgi:hypothetical protein